MPWPLEQLLKEMDVIKQAPLSFFIVLIFCFALAFFVMRWLYRDALSRKDELIATYREMLGLDSKGKAHTKASAESEDGQNSPKDEGAKIIGTVHEQFKAAHEKFMDKLGNATSDAELLMGRAAYHARHEWAIVLQIGPSTGAEICILYLNDERTYTRELDGGVNRDTSWLDDKKLRQKFQTPKGTKDALLYPPWGGLARLWWSRHLEEWKEQIGWRLDHCFNEAVRLQRFEHGRIIGPFRRKEIEYDEIVAFYILMDDNRWATLETEGVPPPCNEPPTTKEKLEDYFARIHVKP